MEISLTPTSRVYAGVASRRSARISGAGRWCTGIARGLEDRVLEFSSQELSSLAVYVDELFGFMQKRHHYEQGPREAWSAPGLSLPAVFQRHAQHFDNNDLDILYFCLAAQLHVRMPALLEELTGYAYATPLAWLMLKDNSLGKNYWNEQYRFDPSRPLFRLGLLTLVEMRHAEQSYILRPLRVQNDVIMAFEGQRSLDERLRLAAQLHEPIYPLAMPPSSEEHATKLRALLEYYHENTQIGEALSVVVSAGRHYPSREAVLSLCRQVERNAIVVDGGMLLALGAYRAGVVLEQAFRSAQLFNEVLVFDAAEVCFGQGQNLAGALRFMMQRYCCLCVLLCGKVSDLALVLREQVPLCFKLDAPVDGIEERAEQVQFWEDSIRRYELNPLEPENCASQFAYRGQEIVNMARAARWLAPYESQFTQRELEEAQGYQAQSQIHRVLQNSNEEDAQG